MARPAAATTISFDEIVGPNSFFPLSPEDPATANQRFLHYQFGSLAVDFAGGTVLTAETTEHDTGDHTSVYATAKEILTGPSHGQIKVFDPTLANPLVITFSEAIHNFEISILNAYAGNYLMSDNAGQSLFFTIDATGDLGVTEGFAAAGTVVQIQYLGPVGLAGQEVPPWDFAIDNVSFNQELTRKTLDPVPEPATFALLGTGLAALIARKVRKSRSA